ncbi:AAA family ATPase [Prevotellamassilia timonensis]|uniref:AAA family ATPase n=1 Tax=Prevotellamassilia timonensis TaxID=1852370 RepID=UPI0040260D3A
MSWRINQIEIKNFKFFKNTFTLNIDRKNILLYGENGAGKSSIYWSVFTHFQAYAKEQAEAQKYFTANHSQNLRNRFVGESESSYIKISFHDGHSETKGIVDSDVDYYPANEETLRFMRGTAMSSDFLNYKILSSLFDFRNSEANQVFDIFEKEILPYIDFDEPYQKIDDETPTNILNAGEWWGYIKKVINTEGAIPRNEKKYSSFNRGTAQYKAYQGLISSFNRLLRNKLQFLVLRANAIIKDVFNIEAKIELTVSDAIFNRNIGYRKYSTTLESPKIYLKARMTSSLLVNDALIEHPRSFFNEAKITCMALALRLAILEDHATTDEFPSVLLIDDLLISLDMPFRRMVIKQLLTYSSRFQTFIFTHDKAFFHLVMSEIKQLEKTNDWKTFNLYVKKDDTGCPQPALVLEDSYIARAKAHLHMLEISASVNALRKAAEKIFKDILSQNEILKIISGQGYYNLSKMIEIFRNKYAKLLGLESLAAHLQDDRKLLLNPFSHDDIETPFYRIELEKTIEEIEQLGRIHKKVIVDYEKIRTVEYKIRVTKDGTSNEVTILFLEQFNSFEYNGDIYYSNPKLFVRKSYNEKQIQCKEWGLNNLLDKMCHCIGYNAETKQKIQDCLYDMGGNLLI